MCHLGIYIVLLLLVLLILLTHNLFLNVLNEKEDRSELEGKQRKHQTFLI